MASERNAQLAARKLAPMLKKRRAFAIDVRKLPRGSGYGVFVFFEEKPKPVLPPSIIVTIGEKRIRVPLRTIVTDVFKPD
jgi:hypothetical protein